MTRTRTFIKKNTAIGLIKKIMQITPSRIYLYTITKNDADPTCYDGLIELDKEDSPAADWIGRGFTEIH